MARLVTEEVPWEFRVLEIVFCIIFAIELALRLFVFRLKFLYMPEWKWNLLDIVLVVVQVVEELTTLGYVLAGSEQSSMPKTRINLMRLLRFLRLVRIIRMLRVLRLIGELRTIVFSVLSCLKTFIWTMLLIALVLYIFGVFFTQVVLNHRLENPGRETMDVFGSNLNDRLEHYYGNLAISVLALFMSISGGVDWENMVQPLLQEIHWIYAFLFVSFISFSVFALLNVVTGVFVDSSLRKAKEDKELYMSNHIRSMFRKLDVDHSGSVEWSEFEKQLDLPNVIDYFKAIDMDTSEARGLFTLLDYDGSGTIDANEFLTGCLKIRGPAKALDLLTLSRETRKIFQSFISHMQGIDGMLHGILSLQERQARLQEVDSASGSPAAGHRPKTCESAISVHAV
jgi:hypothetical protein